MLYLDLVIMMIHKIIHQYVKKNKQFLILNYELQLLIKYFMFSPGMIQ